MRAVAVFIFKLKQKTGLGSKPRKHRSQIPQPASHKLAGAAAWYKSSFCGSVPRRRSWETRTFFCVKFLFFCCPSSPLFPPPETMRPYYVCLYRIKFFLLSFPPPPSLRDYETITSVCVELIFLLSFPPPPSLRDYETITSVCVEFSSFFLLSYPPSPTLPPPHTHTHGRTLDKK